MKIKILVLSVAVSSLFSAQSFAAVGCVGERIYSMSCTSDMFGPGIGTQVIFSSTELHSCVNGQDTVDQSYFGQIDDTGADSVSGALESQSTTPEDYDSSVRIRLVKSAVIKVGTDSFELSISNKFEPVTPGSLEKVYRGTFIKKNDKGQITEKGGLVCGIDV